MRPHEVGLHGAGPIDPGVKPSILVFFVARARKWGLVHLFCCRGERSFAPTGGESESMGSLCFFNYGLWTTDSGLCPGNSWGQTFDLGVLRNYVWSRSSVLL